MPLLFIVEVTFGGRAGNQRFPAQHFKLLGWRCGDLHGLCSLCNEGMPVKKTLPAHGWAFTKDMSVKATADDEGGFKPGRQVHFHRAADCIFVSGSYRLVHGGVDQMVSTNQRGANYIRAPRGNLVCTK